MQRRTMLTTVATVVTVSLTGCLGDDGEAGPESVVESFLTAMDEGDEDRLDELLYPDRPMVVSEDEQTFYELASLQLESTELLSEGEDEAEVAASITLGTDDGELTDEPEIVLRRHDGSWLVYDWDGDLAAH